MRPKASPANGCNKVLRGAVVAAALLMAACAPRATPADPPFWSAECPGGGKAWLLGTIHSLDAPALWRKPAIDTALASADRVVVEVANLSDEAAVADVFARLSRSPGQPPLTARVRADLRDRLAALLEEAGRDAADFREVETWAAALELAKSGGGGMHAKYGIDRAVIAAAEGKPVVELEGAAGQLAIFDALPEAEQRDLLEAVVADSASLDTESGSLASAWRRGDMETIERETHRGILADPELRAALFTQRNRAWADRLLAMLAQGARPLVAVGAAHMAGEAGLPALLRARGCTVSRIR